MRAGSKPGVRGAGGIGVDAGDGELGFFASSRNLSISDVHCFRFAARRRPRRPSRPLVRPRCIYHSTSLSHADLASEPSSPPPSLSSDARALHASSRLGSSKSLISQRPPHPPPHPAERAGSAVEMATLWSAIALAWAVHLHPAGSPSSQELPGCALLRRCPVFLPSLVHPRARKLRLRAASPSRSASRPSTCVGIGLLCLMLADPA